MEKGETQRRTETLKFRVTLQELLNVDEAAYELHLSRSEYLRRRLLGNGNLVLYDFSGLNQLSREIGRIGVNINQIAKKLNQGGTLSQENAVFLRATMQMIHDALQRIYRDAMQKSQGMEKP